MEGTRSEGEISTTESISGDSINSSNYQELDTTLIPEEAPSEASVEQGNAQIAQNLASSAIETARAVTINSGAITTSEQAQVWTANTNVQIENRNAALDIRAMLSEFTSTIEATQQQIKDSMITENKLRDMMQTEVLVPLKASIQKADERITKIETDHGQKIEAHEKAISDTNKKLQTTITDLTSQIESLKRSAVTTVQTNINPAILGRQNNVIIAGLPEEAPNSREDIDAKIKSISVELGCTISSIKARRLGKLDANKPNKVRQVLVEFTSHWEKRKFFSARSKLKDSENYSAVFFNEDLDKRTAELFYKGRSAKKSGKIKSIWTYGCQVYFSKLGSTQPIQLLSEDQLPPPTAAATPGADSTTHSRPGQ